MSPDNGHASGVRAPDARAVEGAEFEFRSLEGSMEFKFHIPLT